jgi:hypothetical protein
MGNNTSAMNQNLSNALSFRDPTARVVRGGSVMFHPGQIPGDLTHMKSVRGRGGGRNTMISSMSLSGNDLTPEQHHPFNGNGSEGRLSLEQPSPTNGGGNGLFSRFLGSGSNK